MANYCCGGIFTGPFLAHIETGQIIPKEMAERILSMDPPSFCGVPDINISVIQQNIDIAEIVKRVIAKFFQGGMIDGKPSPE